VVLFEELTEVHNLDKMSTADADVACSMVLIFAFVWSTGANLQDNPKDNSRLRFSQHIKGKILKFFNGFPYEGEVYDYYIDFQKKEFHPWTELVKDFKYLEGMPYFSILVPTADTVKFKYVLEKLLQGRNNCLISGETGVGKSVIIGEFVSTLNTEFYSYTSFNFSAQTSTKNILDVFMDKDKFTKKRRNEMGPIGNKKMVMFVDDINMPALEKFGAQPPNELLRQIIDQGGFYDLKKFMFMEVSDCVFVAACAPPGGGRNAVSPRLFRHFNMVWTPDLSIRSMETIFTSILKGFLSYTKGLEKFAPSIVKSSVDIYTKIRTELLPTPTKSHYTFNLRDLSKVFQGILEIKYENLPGKEILVSLWVHEASRIFYDRLVDEKDREWFLTLIQGYVKNNFEFEWDNRHIKEILFGDYSNMQKEYQRI
jgi:dynein heavy chain